MLWFTSAKQIKYFIPFEINNTILIIFFFLLIVLDIYPLNTFLVCLEFIFL